jgi:hypothetical protein
MGLYYQTEYRLGRNGGRVCRSYTGLRAFLAIAVDLLFVLTFELTFALLYFIMRIAFRLLTAVAYALTLPFRAARWVSARLVTQAPDHRGYWRETPAEMKPAWVGYDEI